MEAMVAVVAVVSMEVIMATEVVAETVALTVVAVVEEAAKTEATVEVAEVVVTVLIQEAVHPVAMVVAEAGTQDVARRQQAHVEAMAEKAKIQPLYRWNLQE